MHSKYIVTHPNFQTSNCTPNKILGWLKSSHNLFNKVGDRLSKLIINSGNFPFLLNRQLLHYRDLRLDRDYSFVIIDEVNDRAYVGGRDRPLQLHELVMLPQGSSYEIYQVEDIHLLSSDMWVASVAIVLTSNPF